LGRISGDQSQSYSFLRFFPGLCFKTKAIIRRDNVTAKKPAEIGLWMKIHKLPLESKRECRRAFSNIGPRTNAKAMGVAS
jgi:hypothetical protein